MMWNMDWGLGMMIAMSVVWLVIVGGIVTGIVLLVRGLTGRGDAGEAADGHAVAILDERFARGDIDHEDRAYGVTAVTSAGGEPHSVGERLLVAGDEDFVWECGFTQPYDPDVAAHWERAFR